MKHSTNKMRRSKHLFLTKKITNGILVIVPIPMNKLCHFSLKLCPLIINDLAKFIMYICATLTLVEYRYHYLFANPKNQKAP